MCLWVEIQWPDGLQVIAEGPRWDFRQYKQARVVARFGDCRDEDEDDEDEDGNVVGPSSGSRNGIRAPGSLGNEVHMPHPTLPSFAKHGLYISVAP